ncbi:FtsK/SpoIIIE domain-containing protein [Bacillus sp. mrc49]|uniref:FtsK/SpoIIIE domain-containing protein n=1 Tax=Bacillus sp. mrc49 TaxID=2054913 RepID=UPI000C276896|nr:FtsK/SpoIIIE domain-containing protein [Bacillus sp. mrc49]PJN91308.1 cell division protein FtsK [Bacillus sp. mrc49]
MFVEIASTLAFGGLAGFSYVKSNGKKSVKSDSDKILKIFNNAGLNKGGETIRIIRKEEIDNGMMYVFQIPLGLGSEDIFRKKSVIEDGLNTRSRESEIHFKDINKLRDLKWDITIFKQLKKIFTKTKMINKEVEIEFDGMLKVKVFDSPMKKEIPWNKEMLRPGEWKVLIGKKRTELIYHDFDKTKHLIIAGVPGSGKSVVMKLIITSLILSQPDNVTFSLIDLKGGPAFARFKDCKQVENFAVDNEGAMKVLKKVEEDMERVYRDVLVAKGYEDITEAGIKERHFLVIDEAADLAGNGKAVEILTNIVRKGRGSGHYVVYATQYPTVQTVASQIKRNIPARLTYVLDSAIASNAVLDTNGAEDLPDDIPGRGIYKVAKMNHFQTILIKNTEIDKQIKPYITIKPREDEENAKTNIEGTKDGKHSLEFKTL